MSSHHFVRDGQEPALFITHSSPKSHRYFEQLAGWNPVIICTGRIIPALEATGIAWDHALVWPGDLAEMDTAALGPNVQFHSMENAAPGPVLAAILEGHDCRSLRILSENEDDFECWESVAAHLPVTVLTPAMHWVRISREYHKWLPANARLRVHRAHSVNINGQDIPAAAGWRAPTEGRVTVLCDSPCWIGEELGH